jgi:hypothetical protein
VIARGVARRYTAAGKRRQLSALHIDAVANAVCPPHGSMRPEPRAATAVVATDIP